MTAHPSTGGERDVIAAELADAIESHTAALTAYMAATEFTAAEDRARTHLENCAGALIHAEQRLASYDRGKPAPARRWRDRR